MKYNNLTKETKKALRVNDFDSGSVVTFKILRRPTTTTDEKNNKMYIYPRSVRVPNKDVIFDSSAKTEKIVTIGYVTGYKEDGTPILGEIDFPGQKQGSITLNAKKIGDIEKINYLRSCNYNSSNPLAEMPNTGFVFEELKPKATAKEKLNKKKLRRQVENTILDLSNAEAVAYLKVLKRAIYTSHEENVVSLTDFVATQAGMQQFLMLDNDATLPIGALVDDAVKEKVIYFTDAESAWKYSSTNKPFLTVAPGQGEEEFLVNYLFSDKRGQEIKKYIESQLKKDEADEKLKDAKMALDNDKA